MIYKKEDLQALIEKGRIEKALREIDLAILRDPEDEDLLLLQAKCLLMKKEYLKVEEYAKGILKKQPEDIYILFLLSSSLLGQQKYDEGLAVISNALAIDPKSAKAYWYQSRFFLNQKKLTESIESLDKAILLDPSNWEYYFWKGLILENLKLRKEAYPYLKKAFNLHANLVTFLAIFSLFIVNHPNLLRILFISSISLAIIFHSYFFLIPLLLLNTIYLVGVIIHKHWKRVFLFIIGICLLIVFGYYVNNN